jgi:putative PIN family toxin of toxin-antitoxin system
MSGPSVLLDTNVLISGLVFKGGNEHRILRLAEDGAITLVLPEFVIQETERVLAERFAGYAALLDVFLSKISCTLVRWDEFEGLLPRCEGRVRDGKDVPILASIIASKPEFAVTGDRDLREDLHGCEEASATRIFSSRQFLEEFSRQI